MTALQDLVCFSHLRWDFVYQRPQHLMSRFAQTRRVTFVEEPVFEPGANAHLRVSRRIAGVTVVVPVLDEGANLRDIIEDQRVLLMEYVTQHCGMAPTFWFQTPMALPWAPLERAGVVIYDCMDELSAFDGAPPSLVFNEKQLLARADIVFTGGQALFDAKRFKHPRVHCLPSGIDRSHFARARTHRHDRGCRDEFSRMPAGTRVGFAGVIDERLDVGLLAAVADARPDTQFVMVGPVVKIDPATLPDRPNVHYLGMRGYDELPEIMAQWDVAMMPFAHNDATRYISPTKTPEYLAAGLPVVSTSIQDVVRQYGQAGLVAVADDALRFAEAIDAAVITRDDPDRLRAVDLVLDERSWDAIWQRMAALERSATAGGPKVTEPLPAASAVDAL